MPRNLNEEHDDVWRNIANLEKSSDETETTYEQAQPGDNGFVLSGSQSNHDLSASSRSSEVKPYVQALTFLDLDSCVALEEVTFPEQERCSREKFHYRFSKCSELSLGLFTSADTTIATASTSQPTTANPGSATTASTAVPVYSGTPERKSVLLGHIIATKTTNPTVKDEDMALPPGWRAEHKRGMDSPSTVTPAGTPRIGADDEPVPGHKEDGRTLCIHSLAILPEFQGRGLGKLLLRSYIQRMEGSGVADRIAIIAHDELVGFYENMGFEKRGKSEVQLAGGGWTDLTIELKKED
ncbi:Acetyltransferase (GNAT)-like protein 2 [Elsinoe fawcettii]|nr:Acetyltransferase (GNAT)-like protein 2 [Elsinoe fawcettii]